MRTPRALSALALVIAVGIGSCGDPTAGTTSPAVPTMSAAPSTSASTTAGQSLVHLRDGAVITQDDSNRNFAITHGDRAELRLSNDYAWTDPQLAGPGEVAQVTPPEDADYLVWDLVTSGPGNLIITATGVPVCDSGNCNQEDLSFAVSIAVRRP
jgi:hypothetical protein